MAPAYGPYSQEELDAQYDQGTLVPDLGPYVEYWTAASDEARRDPDWVADVPYGKSDAERLDILPASRPGRPVLINIHGGAWKLLGKRFALFPAPLIHAAGAVFVALGFGLAPQVTLGEMVAQVRRAVAWVHANIARYGGDPDAIVVAGHSSGGHLGGCLLASDWQAPHGLPEDVVKGAVLVSGLYDLEPVRLSSRNEYLHLAAADVDALSPIRHIPPASAFVPDVTLLWADGDLAEFRRQSAAFAEAWRAAGHPVEARQIADANHFDLSNAFAQAGSPVADAVARHLAAVDGASAKAV